MRAGELRHRVTVRLPSVEVGTRGQRSGQPTTVRTDVPCSIETLSGSEAEQARQLYADARVQVRMRHAEVPGLTTNHYLVFGERELNIGHADNVDQRDEEWLLLCGEDK